MTARRIKNSVLLIVFAWMFFAGVAAPARAAFFYFETGAGLTEIRSAPIVFSGSASGLPDSLGRSLGLNLTLGFNVATQGLPVDLVLGIQHRYTAPSDNGRQLGLQASYPFFRVEAKRFFLTLGVTPLVWRRNRPDSGFDFYSKASSLILGLTELGWHYPITPEVSVGTAVAAEFPIAHGSFSSNAILSGSFFFRFNYGEQRKSSSGASAEGPGQVPGWRYPFGYLR